MCRNWEFHNTCEHFSSAYALIKRELLVKSSSKWNVYLIFHRHWDEVKSIFMKELIDSGELTQKKLDEAQK